MHNMLSNFCIICYFFPHPVTCPVQRETVVELAVTATLSFVYEFEFDCEDDFLI